ncbi:MAG TPA: M56 family metallopeptidase [Pyrinomonadaceae bacterium]|nr:M56 family metallopeptidase [Pyrinomonadaceae bacterium]
MTLETQTLHERFAAASESFWPLVADHLWQATLFALTVLAVAFVLERQSRCPARVRHALWLVASAKFVVPSALFAWLARWSGFDASVLFGAAEEAGGGAQIVYGIAEPLSQLAAGGVNAGEATGHNEIFCALTLLWLTVGASLAAAWFVRRRAFVVALGEGRRVFGGREFEALGRAQNRLGLKTEAVALLVSPHRIEPGVWRTWRPVVVLPERIGEHLDDSELEAVLLHELVHVERRDNLVGNLQMALCCLFWFHPLVWLIGRRLVSEREQACDERVLEVSGASESYASGILKVVRFCCGWKMAGVSGAGTGSNLRRRIENIMNGETRKLSAWHRALLGATAMAAVSFSVGAGLFSNSLTGDARAQSVVVQGGGTGAGGGRGVARNRINRPGREEGPAVKEIMQTPEISVRFENPSDAPLVIDDAKMRIITRDQLRRATEEGADYYDEEQGIDEYATMPSVTLANTSGKLVREVGIGFAVDEKTGVIMGHRTSLRPGETVTFNSRWYGSNAIMPGNAGNVEVKLVWAVFEDGTQWGSRLPPPPPPVPPSAPHPLPPPHPSAPPPSDGDASVTGEGRSSARARTQDESGGYGGTAGGAGGGVGRGEARAEGGSQTVIAGRLGQLINAPNPVYPPIAKAARAEGRVSVEVTVDEDGRVIKAQAVSGHPLLQSAAVDAAREAQFKPTFLSGKPVKVIGRISYNFVLPKGSGEN